MKKLILAFLVLSSFVGLAQETKSQLTTRFDVIRNETSVGGNTKTRIANAYQELSDGMIGVYPVTASGTNTYTGSLVGLDAYSGRIVFVVFPNNNTGASTFNLNSIGANNIQKDVSGTWTSLSSGDILANKLYRLYNDGTRWQIDLGGSGGGGSSGTVTSISVTTANGVSGSVANATTTPAISLTLGAITPSTVNGVTISGSSTPTLAVTGTSTISGTNTGDQTTVSGNSGTATALQTSRTIGILTGDVTSAGSSFDGTANNTNSTTVTKINGTSLAGLGTGILKNTTGTGVPSIAIAADFPTLNQNTSGTASNLSGTPALPNGTTATTQSSGDNSTKLSTTAYVDAADALKENLYKTSNTYTASHTLDLTDVGKNVEMNVASANNVTIPTDATTNFAIGTTFPIPQLGAGLTSILAPGVTVNSSAGTLAGLGQYSIMYIQKRAANNWYLWNGTANTTSWLLASGGTLTGANTITATSPSWLNFGGTNTTTASNQYHFNINPATTLRATASDIYSIGHIGGSITAGANNQVMSGLLIDNTFSHGAFTGSTEDHLRIVSTNPLLRTNIATTVFGNSSNTQTITISTSGASTSITGTGNSLNLAHGTIVSQTINGTDIAYARGTANNFGGIQLLQNGSNAAGTATQKGSVILNYSMSLWNGSSAYSDFFSVKSTASTASNGVGYYDISTGQSSSIPSLASLLFRLNNSGLLLLGASTNTTHTPNVTLDNEGGQAIRQTTNTQIVANTNDYAIGAGSAFRLSTDASRNITGMTGGVDGKFLYIRNTGSFDIVFKNEDAGSTAANRISCSTGADITIAAGHNITFQYDATSARWFDIASR